MALDHAYKPQEAQASEKELQRAVRNFRPKEFAERLSSLGIVLGKDGRAPMSAGAPRVFLVKDGKAATLDEEGMTVGSPAFIEALRMGQVFAYPAGERRPVQVRSDTRYTSGLSFSEPIEVDMVRKMSPGPPPEPARMPKWYHRLFGFLPGNRDKIDEYEKAERTRAEWEKRIEEIGRSIEETAKKCPSGTGPPPPSTRGSAR